MPALVDLLGPGNAALASWAFYVAVLVVAFVLFFLALIVGLLVMITVPRVLNMFIRPGRVYPLYGLAYAVQGVITRLTNSRFFMLLLGDSSFVVRYVLGLGYDLSEVEQTGSNFGTELGHDSPFLTAVGTGTMISDGLSIMNADYSSTSFRMSQVTVGPRNFVGNNIAFPSGARTGENCLLATKVMVPIDGPVRENVGLLGSPAFEIPRSSARDAKIEYLNDPAEVRRRLRAKNRHNAGSIATVLLVRAVQFFGSLLLAAIALDLYAQFSALAVAAGLLSILVFNVVYSALLERAVLGFRPLTAAVLLDLRPLLLGPRAAVEGLRHADLRRHPVQLADLAAGRRADRPPGVRRRLRDPGEDPDQHRRRRGAQRRQRHPGPLA